jgi:hypothetical protein
MSISFGRPFVELTFYYERKSFRLHLSIDTMQTMIPLIKPSKS